MGQVAVMGLDQGLTGRPASKQGSAWKPRFSFWGRSPPGAKPSNAYLVTYISQSVTLYSP